MKRIIAMMLGLVMALSIAVPAFAADEPAARPEQTAEDYALTFMDSVDGKTRQVKATTPMYDYTGSTVTGWYVTFTADGSPAGYVVLDLFDAGSPIMEFATEGEGIVPTTYATGNTLVFEGGGRMYVKTHDGSFYDILFQDTVDMETVQATASSPVMAAMDINDGFVDYGSITLQTQKTITNLKHPSYYPNANSYAYPSTGSATANCGPVAATNILLYWGRDRGMASAKSYILSTTTVPLQQAKPLYQAIYNAMGTTGANGTSTADTIKGYTAILGAAGGNWNYENLFVGAPNTTTINSFKPTLDRNVPVQLFVSTTAFNLNMKGTQAHFMFCCGYAKATNGTDYLCVLDGTNDVVRFVKLANNYPWMQAYSINVTK